MIKWFIVLLAVLGAYCLINSYLPQSWHNGFTVKGYLVPYAALMLVGLIWVSSKLKAD